MIPEVDPDVPRAVDAYWAIAVEQLLAKVRVRATVLRQGARVEVPIEAVVPGDVVLLTAGDIVPGDARILESRDLYVDEAALTGESFPAEKQPGIVPAAASLPERTNTLFLGTHVVSGIATALVVQTGATTVFGGISAEPARRPPATEFEHGVRRFGYLLLEIVCPTPRRRYAGRANRTWFSSAW